MSWLDGCEMCCWTHVEGVGGGRVGRHHPPSPSSSNVSCLHVSRQLSLPLVTTILEPDLHLANNFVESVKYFLHLTWVSVKWSEAARAALSLLDKYLFRSNVDSSWKTWDKNILDFGFSIVQYSTNLTSREDSSCFLFLPLLIIIRKIIVVIIIVIILAVSDSNVRFLRSSCVGWRSLKTKEGVSHRVETSKTWQPLNQRLLHQHSDTEKNIWDKHNKNIW